MEEYGTAIHKLSVPLCHSSSPGLRTEDALIALSAQLRVEERVVLVCLYFLQISVNNSVFYKFNCTRRDRKSVSVAPKHEHQRATQQMVASMMLYLTTKV